MICLSPSDAEGITVADITLRYVRCCYTVAELYLFSGIPWDLWKYFFRVWPSNPYQLDPVTRHDSSSGFRQGKEFPVYKVTENKLYSTVAYSW